MSNLVAVSDIEKMAGAIVKSNFFGMKTIEQAMALMFIAQAEGKHPATAAQEYHVIQGKPALKADAMLARFQAAGGKVQWKTLNDKEVTGVFSHPQGGSAEITWTMKMATDAKLTGKDTWKQYPRQMLRARVVSEGIRTVYPGVAVGVYTPEEVQDFEPTMTDVTPASSQGITPYDIDETKPKSIFKKGEHRKDYQKNVIDSLEKCKNKDELNTIISLELDKLTAMRASGDSRDQMTVDSINNKYRFLLARFEKPEDETPTFYEEEIPPFIKDMDEAFKGAVG